MTEDRQEENRLREIDDKIEEWHTAPRDSEIARKSLCEHLGMTWQEYQKFVGS